MWWILCSADDRAATWAAAGLRRRGLEPLELVSGEELVCALSWQHRLGAAPPTVRIHLAGGRVIDHSEVLGVLNRLTRPPVELVAARSAADGAYAAGELQALILSCLAALDGAVVNRPSPYAMTGAVPPPAALALLAHRCGLLARDYRATSDGGGDPPLPTASERTVFIVGERLVPEGLVDAATAAGCRRLAAALGHPHLALRLAAAPEGWRLAGADPCPDLRPGGEPLLDALAGLLGGPFA